MYPSILKSGAMILDSIAKLTSPRAVSRVVEVLLITSSSGYPAMFPRPLSCDIWPAEIVSEPLSSTSHARCPTEPA